MTADQAAATRPGKIRITPPVRQVLLVLLTGQPSYGPSQIARAGSMETLEVRQALSVLIQARWVTVPGWDLFALTPAGRDEALRQLGLGEG